jgi:hypothetical protein
MLPQIENAGDIRVVASNELLPRPSTSAGLSTSARPSSSSGPSTSTSTRQQSRPPLGSHSTKAFNTPDSDNRENKSKENKGKKVRRRARRDDLDLESMGSESETETAHSRSDSGSDAPNMGNKTEEQDTGDEGEADKELGNEDAVDVFEVERVKTAKINEWSGTVLDPTEVSPPGSTTYYYHARTFPRSSVQGPAREPPLR